MTSQLQIKANVHTTNAVNVPEHVLLIINMDYCENSKVNFSLCEGRKAAMEADTRHKRTKEKELIY